MVCVGMLNRIKYYCSKKTPSPYDRLFCQSFIRNSNHRPTFDLQFDCYSSSVFFKLINSVYAPFVTIDFPDKSLSEMISVKPFSLFPI